MNTSTRRMSVVMGAAVLCGTLSGAWWLTRVPAPAPLPSDAPSPAASPESGPAAALHWQTGSHQSWALELSGTSQTRWAALPGESEGIHGSASLRARLHAQVDAVDSDGVAVVQFWVADVDAAEFSASATPDPANAAFVEALANARLVVRMDRCGGLVALQDSGNDHPGDPVIQAILETGWPIVCADAGQPAGTVARHTPHGLAHDTIRTSGSAAEAVIMLEARSYSALQAFPSSPPAIAVTVEGQTRVQAGALVETRLTEVLQVGQAGQLALDAETSVSLGARRDHDASVPVATVEQWRAPGDREPGRSMQQQLLQQRAGDLDAARLRTTLETWGASGTVPNHNDFLWRAPARIALDPVLADEIADMVVADTATSAGRGLMLDLLAQTKHQAATAALLRSLQHPAVQADRMYPLLLQRVSFVQDPTHDLVAWVAEQSQQAPRSNDRIAAQYALGSLVSALDTSEANGLADTAHAQLVQTVASASTAATQVHALRALANADRDTDLVIFTAAATSLEPSVRRAAAEGLGGVVALPSTGTLLTLVGDPHEDVQRAALASLRDHPLQPDALLALTSLAQRGELHEDNALHLLDLAKYYVEAAPTQVLALAEAVEALTTDSQTIAAARELARRARPN